METFFGAILLLIGIALSVSFIAVGKKMIFAMVPYTGRYLTRPAVVTLAFTMMICIVVGSTMVLPHNEVIIPFIILMIAAAGIFARKFAEAKTEFSHKKQEREIIEAYKPTNFADENDIKNALK